MSVLKILRECLILWAPVDIPRVDGGSNRMGWQEWSFLGVRKILFAISFDMLDSVMSLFQNSRDREGRIH